MASHSATKAAATLIADIWASVLRAHNKKTSSTATTSSASGRSVRSVVDAAAGPGTSALDSSEKKENVGIQASFPDMNFEDEDSSSESDDAAPGTSGDGHAASAPQPPPQPQQLLLRQQPVQGQWQATPGPFFQQQVGMGKVIW